VVRHRQVNAQHVDDLADPVGDGVRMQVERGGTGGTEDPGLTNQ
jgi:hypothetical protein